MAMLLCWLAESRQRVLNRAFALGLSLFLDKQHNYEPRVIFSSRLIFPVFSAYSQMVCGFPCNNLKVLEVV